MHGLIRPIQQALSTQLIEGLLEAFPDLSARTRIMDIQTREDTYDLAWLSPTAANARPLRSAIVQSHIHIEFQKLEYRLEGDAGELYFDFHPAVDILFRRVAP